jgi:hypothetical protein
MLLMVTGEKSMCRQATKTKFHLASQLQSIGQAGQFPSSHSHGPYNSNCPYQYNITYFQFSQRAISPKII